MRARLTSSHFVGRIGELAELQLAVQEATSGRAALVLLGGDSGVGKTRLVGELEQRLTLEAQADETPVILRGDGVEPADGELPYAPLLSALRPLVRQRHPALDALSTGSRTQLASILPGLDDGSPREERPDPSGQLRLFEALLELLDLLSASAPVVLILEDMHWADRSTRAFVGFAARSLRQERIVLVLTYRTDELHRRHPLRPLLAELERLERAHRIELEPFDRDELAEVLADILGAEPKAQLLERLYSRSEGNPLYTEELLAAGLDGRGSAPQSLRDAFLTRIERLSPDAQRAARAVAVGRALDEPTLGTVMGADHELVQGALRETVSEQVLIAGEDEQFCFRHALLREALYDDLLPGERGEWHLALALALEEAPPTGDDGREAERATIIASHYASAGDQPAALRASVHAALAAGRVHAYGEVSELVERALELWPRVSEDARPSALDHVGLLALAARAYGIAGDRQRADVLLTRALEEIDPATDCERYASLLGRLSRVQYSLNRGPEAIATAERALSLLPSDQVSRERAALLSWLARMRSLRGRFRDAITDAEIALEAAVAAGDSMSEGEVLNTLGMSKVILGEVSSGVEHLERAIEIARSAGDMDSQATGYTNLADMLFLRGRTSEALRTAEAGLEATPKPFVRPHDWSLMTVSEISFHFGDWARSSETLDACSGQQAGSVGLFHLLREAELALGKGDEELAERALDESEGPTASTSESQRIGLHGSLLGELRRRQRDFGAARAAVEWALDRIELCTDDVMRIAQVSATGARIEADRAQRARDLSEKAELRDALTRVRLHVQRLDAAAQGGGPVERAHLAEGKAESARARGRTGVKEWAQAVAAWEAVERPYAAAIARWRQAEAQVVAGERAAASETASQALETAIKLGSDWLTGEIRALGERGRLDLGHAGESPAASADGAPATTEPADPFGLTPRERQVLALLAEGATNRQIGAALFMAEKTASVHVSRILAKLGVQGRTQAAALAHRQHLA